MQAKNIKKYAIDKVIGTKIQILREQKYTIM